MLPRATSRRAPARGASRGSRVERVAGPGRSPGTGARPSRRRRWPASVRSTESTSDSRRRRGLGEQLERDLVVAGGLVGPADRHGLVAGLDAGAERGRAVVRRRACRASSAAVPAGRRLPSASTYAACSRTRSPGQQVVVDRLGEQGVPERVAAGADGDQHVAPRRRRAGPRRRAGRRRGRRRAASRAWETRRPAHRRGAHHAREPCSSSRSRRTSSRSARSLGQPGRSALAAAHELLDEERVALGAVDDRRALALRQRLRVQDAARGDARRRRAAAAAPSRVHPGQPGPLGDRGRSGWRRCRSSVR